MGSVSPVTMPGMPMGANTRAPAAIDTDNDSKPEGSPGAGVATLRPSMM